MDESVVDNYAKLSAEVEKHTGIICLSCPTIETIRLKRLSMNKIKQKLLYQVLVNIKQV